MFYSNNQIKNILICDLCGNLYSDPRIVPCGRTYCNKCITETSPGVYKCSCEEKYHAIPARGFPKNLLAENLLAQEPGKVSRGEKAEQLKTQLDGILKELSDVELNLNKNVDEIIMHCDTIKDQIDQVCAKEHSKYSKSKEELIDRINEYQIDCLKNLMSSNNIKSELEKSINQFRDFHTYWKMKFEQYSMDEHEISEALTSCRDYLTRIAINKFDLTRYSHQDKMTKFKDNVAKVQPIGYLQFQTPSDLVDLSNQTKIELKSLNINSVQLIDFDINEVAKILIGVVESDWGIKLTIYNSAENKIETSKAISRNYGSNTKLIKCCLFEDKILLAIKFVEGMNNKSDLFLLKISDFQIIKENSFMFNLLDTHLDSEFIYSLGDNNFIHICDHNLTYVRDVSTKKFNISSDIVNIRADHNCLFLLAKDFKISMVNMKDELLLKSFYINGNLFSIYNESYVISYNQNSKLIFFYDFSGTEVRQEMIKTEINPTLIRGGQNKVLFFDQNLQCICI